MQIRRFNFFLLNRSLKNNNGSALLMVLAASAVLGLVGYGVVTQITNTMKHQQHEQAKSQLADVTAEVKNIIKSQSVCSSLNFTGLMIPSSLQSIKSENGVVRFTVGDKDKSNLLKIESMKIENFVASTSNPLIGIAELNVKLSKIDPADQVSSVFAFKPIPIKLDVELNPDRSIKTCKINLATLQASSSADPYWQAQDANSSNINYLTGNVGVGVLAPTNKFEVDGDISVNQSVNKIFSNIFDVIHSTPQFNKDVPFMLFPNSMGMIIIANNSLFLHKNNLPGVTVGVGNAISGLSVNGEIKIGDVQSMGNTICDITKEGTQRYNGLAGKKCMEFCDGIQWQCIEPFKPQDCVGSFSTCDTGTGLRSYMIFIPAEPGGKQCDHLITETSSMGCAPPGALTCTGSWGSCVAGIQTYTVSSQPIGATCSPANGDTQSCSVPTCTGSWGSCVAGIQTYTVSSQPIGATCSPANGDTQSCSVPTCTGSWGSCIAGIQTYKVKIQAAGVVCSPANGDTKACGTSPNCTCPVGWITSGSKCYQNPSLQYVAICPSTPIYGTTSNNIPGHWVLDSTTDLCTGGSTINNSAMCYCVPDPGAEQGLNGPCHGFTGAGGIGINATCTINSGNNCPGISIFNGSQCEVDCATLNGN